MAFMSGRVGNLARVLCGVIVLVAIILGLGLLLLDDLRKRNFAEYLARSAAYNAQRVENPEENTFTRAVRVGRDYGGGH